MCNPAFYDPLATKGNRSTILVTFTPRVIDTLSHPQRTQSIRDAPSLGYRRSKKLHFNAVLMAHRVTA